jgi:hypothetical protein
LAAEGPAATHLLISFERLLRALLKSSLATAYTQPPTMCGLRRVQVVTCMCHIDAVSDKWPPVADTWYLAVSKGYIRDCGERSVCSS